MEIKPTLTILMASNRCSGGFYVNMWIERGKNLICKMNEVNVIHSTAYINKYKSVLQGHEHKFKGFIIKVL